MHPKLSQDGILVDLKLQQILVPQDLFARFLNAYQTGVIVKKNGKSTGNV
jgi:hypothetical protein